MSGSGSILDDETRESDEVNYGEEDPLDGYGGEAQSLLSDPTGYIREIVFGVLVGGVLSAITFTVRFGLDLFAELESALGMGGGAILDSVTVLWSELARVIVIPITTAEGVAAGAGVFAPLVVAVSFLFAAALAGGIVWGTVRVVGFI